MKKITELTPQEMDLIDEREADKSTIYPRSDRVAEQEFIHSVVKGRILILKESPPGTPIDNIVPVTPGKDIGDGRLLTGDDIIFYQLTHPQIFGSDERREETILRLQNQTWDRHNQQLQEDDSIYPLSRNLRDNYQLVYPSLDELPSYNFNPSSNAMTMNLTKDPGDANFSKMVQQGQSLKSVIKLNVKFKEEGTTTGSVVYYEDEFLLLQGDNPFLRFLKPESGKEYELDDSSLKSWQPGAPEKLWYEEELGKVYEEKFDNTCRVCVDVGYDLQNATQRVANFMEDGYKKGAELILKKYKKDFREENLQKIESRDGGAMSEHLILAVSYYVPPVAGNIRVLVLAYLPKIQKLPHYEEQKNLKGIVVGRNNFKKLENARNDILSRKDQVDKYKSDGGSIAVYDYDKLSKKIKDILSELDDLKKSIPIPENYDIVLMVDNKYNLEKINIYKDRYDETDQSKNLAFDGEKDKREHIVDTYSKERRIYYLLSISSDDKKYSPSMNMSLEQWFADKIRYPKVNLVPNSQSTTSSGKKSPKAMQPNPKHNLASLNREQRAVTDSDDKKAAAEDSRNKKEKNWFERNFPKSTKEYNDNYSSKEKLFDTFFSKFNHRQIMMDALRCLMSSQTGQSYNAIMNDVNVLTTKYNEYKKWNKGKNMFEEGGKSFGEHLSAVPEMFFPDDFPVDDMSLAFSKELRETIALIVQQLLSHLATTLLRAFFDFCQRPDPALPLPSERQAIPDFNFDRLGELIDALYDGLISKEELEDIFEGMSDRFTILEICSLLEGEPSPDTLAKAFQMMQEYCIEWLDNEDKVRDFFASIGESMGDLLEICDQIRSLNDKAPVDDDYLCPPNMDLLRNRLLERGLSEEQADRQIAEEQARRNKLAEDLLTSLNDGIMSGDFVMPSVFCQKDEEGNVQQGSVSFFDDQFKYVAKETMESMFSTTYNKFKSEGNSLKNSYLTEVVEPVRVEPYRRHRKLKEDGAGAVESDIFPEDKIIQEVIPSRQGYELVESVYKEMTVKRPVPYIIDFYKEPTIKMIGDDARIDFPHDFESQLRSLSSKIGNLRENISDSREQNQLGGNNCSSDATELALKDLVDRISSGIDQNSRSKRITFQERYHRSVFIEEEVRCEHLIGDGIIYNPFTHNCECDEQNGYTLNPNYRRGIDDGQPMCIKVQQSQQNNEVPQLSEENCAPPSPPAVVETPPLPTPFRSTEQESSETNRPTPPRKEVQYNLQIEGGVDYPTTNYYYNKPVPESVLEFLRGRQYADHSSLNVFYEIMRDNLYNIIGNSEETERALSIIFPENSPGVIDRRIFFDFKEAIMREVMDLVTNGNVSPYLRQSPPPSGLGDGNGVRGKYAIEHVDLGPDIITFGEGEYCDPHLLQIRQVLEEMFDELGDNMCLDIHSKDNLDDDGIPRLKPLEKAAMSACIKVTLRHYLIENITRGMVTNAAFDKIGAEISDLKLNYIIGKMKLAMDSYSTNYFENFCKYSLAVYDGPTPEDTTYKTKKRVLIDMLRKQYSKISYNLREALLLGDGDNDNSIGSPSTQGRNNNFFVNMFNDVLGSYGNVAAQADREIVIYREVATGDLAVRRESPSPFSRRVRRTEEVQEIEGILSEEEAQSPFDLGNIQESNRVILDIYERVGAQVQRQTRGPDSRRRLMGSATDLDSIYSPRYRSTLMPHQFDYIFGRLTHQKDPFTDEIIHKPRISFAVEKSPTGARLIAIIPWDTNKYGDIVNGTGLPSIIKESGYTESEFKNVLFQRSSELTTDSRNFQVPTRRLGTRFYNEEQLGMNDVDVSTHRGDMAPKFAQAWTFPIFEYKYENMDIENMPENLITLYQDLNLSSTPENLVDLWTGEVLGSTPYFSYTIFELYRERFYQALGEDKRTKMLFEYCFPVKEYATLLNVHEMETNTKNIDIVSNFGETRDSLYGVFYAVQPQVNDWQKQPKALEDLAAGLGLPGLFPGQLNQLMNVNTQLYDIACTRLKFNFGLGVCWGNPFNGLGFSFILKAARDAALRILKNWIEKNDPNIKLAKQLSFLTQLACIDISTSATSGLVHAAFPWMSTQFTAIYNALGLGDLSGGSGSDSSEGEDSKKQIEDAGLSLPNYCGIGNRPAGDPSLDAAAERGARIERLHQIRLNEESIRTELAELMAEMEVVTASLDTVRKEIDRIDIRKSWQTDGTDIVGNPFSNIEFDTNYTTDLDGTRTGSHSISTRESVNEYRGRSLKNLRRERDRLKRVRDKLVKRIIEITDDLQFLDEMIAQGY